MATIVITGATGFIGGHLLPVLTACGHTIVAAGRRPSAEADQFAEIADIGPHTDWQGALVGADVIVHLAGLAHGKSRGDADYHAVNADGTRRLCEAAEAAGVRAIINISSIAARDEGRGPDRLASYARSKLEGETYVAAFGDQSGRIGISLRPPLVVGWNAPANWRMLQKLAATGLPLPFGAIKNRRSFCAVENLCAAIATAVEHALNGDGSGTYEVADLEILSLPEVVACLRRGMMMPPRLVPVPIALLRRAGSFTGRSGTVDTLVGDLIATPHRFMRKFEWSPPILSADAITASGRRFRSGASRPD